jgi:uncharacterized protein YkwD
MFPHLPQDTVEAALSELFRADANLTRQGLAERAVCALVEMSLADGSPRAITSFEPPNVFDTSSPVPVADTEQAPDPTRSALPSSASTQVIDIEMEKEVAVTATDESFHLLDLHIGNLLSSLPDDALLPCAQTLASILDRIADDPTNARVRRLRHGNKAFAAKVGCHAAAVDFLRIAGFQDDPGENEDDRGMVFCGDHSESSAFGRARDAIHGVAEHLSGMQQPPKAALPSGQGLHTSAREMRRDRTAALTEQRLRNPNQFRHEALTRGAANKANGGVIAKKRRPAEQTEVVPQRQSRHFNLSDIERMRIDDEIAGTSNYAEEYRRNKHSEPARDYSTLVSRSYDGELISRQALDGTNRYRASKGLPPCRWHAGIACIAAEHAASMASGAAPFSHDGFNARVSRFPAQRGAGENLALSSGISDVAGTAVDGWIKSPGHEKNLRGNWNVCGIGTARSANGTFYTTQLFALCI